jgi:hypothetical protein
LGLNLLPAVLMPVLITGGWVYVFARRNRERVANAPLSGKIKAQVVFETTLYRASILGTGGLGGNRGYWFSLRGPKRLIVGIDAFLITAPQALREFVFAGRECSIAFSRMSAGPVGRDRDWIVITSQVNGRQVDLAITQDNLMDIWQALAGTGATSASD